MSDARGWCGDNGTWSALRFPTWTRRSKRGLKFTLNGKKRKALGLRKYARLRASGGESWLLIKHRDKSQAEVTLAWSNRAQRSQPYSCPELQATRAETSYGARAATVGVLEMKPLSDRISHRVRPMPRARQSPFIALAGSTRRNTTATDPRV